MLLKTIKQFIEARIREHPQIEPWLGNWSPDHETQINIDITGLEPCSPNYEAFLRDKPTHWCDDEGYEYRPIRIPYGAMTDSPSFRDREVMGPIHERWQLIGTTGWNWREKKSMWVGFDFDAISNHTEGLSSETLEEVKQRAFSLDYVKTRTSKSGHGIHLLVYLKPQQTTRNHREHSQLAKDVLSRMSDDCGFDFDAAADVGGGILWHWQRGLSDDGCKRINNDKHS